MTHSSGQIQLIIGPMFSGKTTELIRRIKRCETANQKCMIIKYENDTRYDEENDHIICTHDKQKYTATIRASQLKDVKQIAKSYTVIGIDEGQFFKDVTEFSEEMANLGKIVIVAALDGTYQRRGFGDILNLVPLAEYICKLKAVCMICYNEASFTKRKGCETQIELIGGTEAYLSVCRNCYNSDNNKDMKKIAQEKKQLNNLTNLNQENNYHAIVTK